MIDPAIEDEAVHLSADPQAIEFAPHKFDASETFDEEDPRLKIHEGSPTQRKVAMR